MRARPRVREGACEGSGAALRQRRPSSSRRCARRSSTRPGRRGSCAAAVAARRGAVRRARRGRRSQPRWLVPALLLLVLGLVGAGIAYAVTSGGGCDKAAPPVRVKTEVHTVTAQSSTVVSTLVTTAPPPSSDADHRACRRRRRWRPGRREQPRLVADAAGRLFSALPLLQRRGAAAAGARRSRGGVHGLQPRLHAAAAPPAATRHRSTSRRHGSCSRIAARSSDAMKQARRC